MILLYLEIELLMVRAVKRRKVFKVFETEEPLYSLKHSDVMKFVNLTKRFANFQFDVGVKQNLAKRN